MTAANLLVVIKALFVVWPMLILAAREGRLKTGAYDEVINAIQADWDARIKAAQSVTEKDFPDENDDPNNRSRGSGSIG